MSVETNYNQFAKQINKLNTFVDHLPKDVVRPGAKRGFQKHGRLFVASIQRSMRGSREDESIIHRRTGTLGRAFHHDVFESEGRLSEFVWIDKTAIHWRPHEFGATIKPKGHKFLAIPSEYIQTSAGVSRYKSPTEIADLEYARLQSKDGKKRPVLGKTIDGEFKVFFWLVTQVKIPARLGLREKWALSTPLAVPIVIEEIQKELAVKTKQGINRLL